MEFMAFLLRGRPRDAMALCGFIATARSTVGVLDVSECMRVGEWVGG